MKIVRRILLVLVCLILAGYLAYKIAYPYVAPLVFDYVVDHHMDAFVKLEQSLLDSLEDVEISGESESDSVDALQSGELSDDGSEPSKTEEALQNQEPSVPSDSDKATEGKKPSEKTPDSPSASQKPSTGADVTTGDSGEASSKGNTDIQSVKTTMGVFSGEHLARALKNMTPADKTRIISLCQSAVSASDIVKVTKIMMQDGLTKEQQKYIENFLRDNLSVPYKREILEILKKY